MEAQDVFSLGLGLIAPWKLSGQRLDIDGESFRGPRR